MPGVQLADNTIEFNAHDRTTAKHIYACGDVTGNYQFTDIAAHNGENRRHACTLRIPFSTDQQRVPWCTFADHELAHVGGTDEAL